MDTYYEHTCSVWLDLVSLARTAANILLGLTARAVQLNPPSFIVAGSTLPNINARQGKLCAVTVFT